MLGYEVDGPGFRLRITPADGYLRVYVFGGSDSLDVSIAVWRMVVDACERHAMRRVLVAEDLADALDPAQVEQLVEAVVDERFLGLRVAFVDLRHGNAAHEHGEILALERGIAARVFGSESQARHWLLFGDEHAGVPA